MLSNMYKNTTTISILIKTVWNPESVYDKLTCLKLSSIFVSKIIKISILSLIWFISNSNLFRRDLIFKCPIISLIKFITVRDLDSTFIQGLQGFLYKYACQYLLNLYRLSTDIASSHYHY